MLTLSKQYLAVFLCGNNACKRSRHLLSTTWQTLLSLLKHHSIIGFLEIFYQNLNDQW